MHSVHNISFNMVVRDALIAIPLFIYIIVLVFIAAKRLYGFMTSRGVRHNVAVYFNRKFIHMLTGGIVAILVPLLFREPIIPMLFAYMLAVFIYLPHRSGRILTWFQTDDNMYEVNFCIAWGTSIAILWLLTGNPWISVLPALAISFGDAVTGIVRNVVFGYRTKHWLGNIAMAATMIPIGYILSGWIGIVAMIIASAIEKIELNPIDDNILIAFTTTVILAVNHLMTV
ncbi:MAG: dolichol kinase [Ignisphaera sp.]|nr:dolichol kinase [Ignisphaera sp.]MCX8167538.1 dolichol kinase [Ignisphaera sp.]MDW8086010.1 dolichol kinase [Ignisphaera sp.]